MTDAKGLRQVGYFDCPGGGQIVVEDGVAYIGHMEAPAGTTTVDVRDPANPKQIAHLAMPDRTHSHKVRVGGDLMVTNREALPFQKGHPEGFKGGLGIWDNARRGHPKLITVWETEGMGVHRFDFDGRYAYISPTVDGYLGNIVMILDLKNPERPEEVGRWWLPGQWTAGGEEPTWKGAAHRCHHPLRRGDRLYTSYWHGGFVILDIEDMSKPKMISHLDWSPPFPWPTHTTLPLPYRLQGRDIMLVADEDVLRTHKSYPSFLWLVDITDEAHPMPFSSFQIDAVDGSEQPEFTGCHQPSEKVDGTEIPVAWFAHGLRIVDIAKPHAPKEIAHFMPEPQPGCDRVQSNDVTFDERGLIYLLDRLRGMVILERV
ncbi:MAG: hypothetical protein GEU92_15610 [Alphaproteobacteria bacterium]|nr:hypothetical protein [Alphaproteobacteria bacterium]